MRIVFWVLANLALLLAVMHLLSALRVRRAYRPLGGALLAAFTNGTLVPQLASLALRGTPGSCRPACA